MTLGHVLRVGLVFKKLPRCLLAGHVSLPAASGVLLPCESPSAFGIVGTGVVTVLMVTAWSFTDAVSCSSLLIQDMESLQGFLGEMASVRAPFEAGCSLRVDALECKSLTTRVFCKYSCGRSLHFAHCLSHGRGFYH